MEGGKIDLLEEKAMDHTIYRRADNPKEADGHAWVFADGKNICRYNYKLPTLTDEAVRIRVLYSGLCHSDTMAGRGNWGPRFYPLCPGHEIFGEVQYVGQGVTTLKPGELVAVGPLRTCCFRCKNCNEKKSNICLNITFQERDLYATHFGGFCSHMQVPVHHVFKLPKGVNLATDAPLMCAGVTVFIPLKRFCSESKGKSIAVLGCGGLGHLAIKYARALGLHVTAITQTADKKEGLEKIGAQEVIVYDNEYRDLIKNQGRFDFVINTVPIGGKEFCEACLGLLAFGGTCIQVGAPDIKENFQANFFNLVLRQIKVVGSLVGSIEDTIETLEFSVKHKIKVEVEEFAFQDFNKALDLLEKGRPRFRCVLNVKDYSDKYFPSQEKTKPK